MKILTLCTLSFIFCGIGVLSVHPHEGHSHAQAVDTLWAEQLVTFEKLLKTDPNAARVELQNVGKNLFNGHILVDEWVPLFFRLYRDGTKDPSDVKRWLTLEIRMLMAIDAEKYTKQIRQHQEALKDLTEIEDAFSDEPLKGPIKESIPTEQQSRSEISSQVLDMAFETFFLLLPDNPEAARSVLGIYALLAFDNHSLTQKWKELFFQLCQDKEATHSEAIRLFELKKQMLTDNSPQKHAKEIKRLERMLKQMKLALRLLGRHGETDKKLPFAIAPE